MGFTMARFWVVLALADQPVTKISFRLALKNWLPLLNVWPIIFLIAGSFTWLMAWLAMGLNLGGLVFKAIVITGHDYETVNSAERGQDPAWSRGNDTWRERLLGWLIVTLILLMFISLPAAFIGLLIIPLWILDSDGLRKSSCQSKSPQ